MAVIYPHYAAYATKSEDSRAQYCMCVILILFTVIFSVILSCRGLIVRIKLISNYIIEDES